MTLVHLLTSQKETTYNSGCGLSQKAKGPMPDNFSGWSSDITCPKCATRLWVTHSMTKILDLDDPTLVQKFHFTGKPWKFRWLRGEQLVYIFEENSNSAMCAVPVSNFVPDCLQRTPEYTDAQVTAREWVIKHGNNREYNAPKNHRNRVKKTAPPPKPKVPEGYTGSLCCVCGKIDEGDFVTDPNNMLQEICMTCLISQK